jgi:hypothetical protein
MAGDVPALTAWVIHPRADGAPSWQDHDSGGAIAHSTVFTPGSLSVIASPAQRQSAEAVRRVREILLKVGAKAGQRQCLCAGIGQRLARAGVAGQRRLDQIGRPVTPIWSCG